MRASCKISDLAVVSVILLGPELTHALKIRRPHVLPTTVAHRFMHHWNKFPRQQETTVSFGLRARGCTLMPSSVSWPVDGICPPVKPLAAVVGLELARSELSTHETPKFPEIDQPPRQRQRHAAEKRDSQ